MNKKLRCILIIDDDEPTNFITEMLIDEAGCTEHIQIAQTGQSALNYLSLSERLGFEDQRNPFPELILLDINMPAMNGWEFIERYRNIQKNNNKSIIVVMLTTSLNPDDRLKAQNTPEIIGFENKPLTTERLNFILRTYFAADC